MQIQLKPCPFCQGKEIVIRPSLRPFRAYCKSCGAEGPPSRDSNMAALYWNAGSLEWTRATPTEAGFYFYRNFFGCVSVVKFLPKLIEFHDCKGEWAGPIPEPVKEEQC